MKNLTLAEAHHAWLAAGLAWNDAIDRKAPAPVVDNLARECAAAWCRYHKLSRAELVRLRLPA